MKRARLHVISHTHWDREWYQDFQGYRRRLVHQTDALLDLIERVNRVFVDTTAVHSSLPAYLEALKAALGRDWQAGRRRFRGELRSTAQAGAWNELMTGCASSRVLLKQANDAIEWLLAHGADPLHADRTVLSADSGARGPVTVTAKQWGPHAAALMVQFTLRVPADAEPVPGAADRCRRTARTCGRKPKPRCLAREAWFAWKSGRSRCTPCGWGWGREPPCAVVHEKESLGPTVD